MTTKWASCSTSGRVTFSTELLRAEHDWQEYVIVHELLHLHIPNHGRLFKAMLSALLPEWEQIASRQAGREMPYLGLTRDPKLDE
jgi:predicted metal-dependent hydrolase